MMQLGPGQYEIKSFVEEFSGEHKIHKGKFGTVAQYPDPPTDRIYNATLSQYPRNIVSSINIFCYCIYVPFFTAS